LFSLKKKNTPLLGVDISSTSVKVIELSTDGIDFKVESYGVEPIPDTAMTEKSINDIEVVGECIKKAIKKSGSSAKLAAIAIPGSAVITKIIPMPSVLNEADLETQIYMEADQYIPYPMEDINLDFEIIGPCEQDENAVDVLIAASKSENIELRSASIAIAGITTKLVDIEPYTVEHAFALFASQVDDEESDDPIAVFDIGATTTSLSVIKDGKLIYTREQAFGGKQLTEEIMKRYGLSYEDAGKVKKLGGLPDNYEAEVLDPFKNTLAQQVSRFLQFFYSASQFNGVSTIVLAGGSSAITGIDEYIETNLGIKTVIANPFIKTSISSKIQKQKLHNDAAALLIACGLAMRGLY
jgi:type IV pilus assembly protein PilM